MSTLDSLSAAIGDLALDFVNVTRAIDERELSCSELLLEWSVRSRILSTSEAATALRGSAGREEGRRLTGRAVVLRDTLFAIFSSIAGRRPLSSDALIAFERFAIEAAQQRCLEPSGAGAVWVWRFDRTEPDAMLWPVIEAATTLLTSSRVARVKICEGENCETLFLDNSQKRNRRWCAMGICGNRAKARRHYERAKSSSGDRPKPAGQPRRGIAEDQKLPDSGAFVWM